MAAALRGLDGVVAVSQYCKEQMADRCGLSNDGIVVIPSGLDIDLFAPPQSGPPAPPVMGYLARLSEEKGAMVALESYAALRQRPGLETLRLEMGGSVAPGGQAFVDGLTAVASSHSDARIVSNLGLEEKVAFLQGMSVLCVPGRMHEVAALYVIEALASGVPVVAAGEGGAGELVRATGGGLTYRAGNDAEMLEALATVLEDTALRAELGGRGRAVVQEVYTASAMAKRWVEYLEA